MKGGRGSMQGTGEMEELLLVEMEHGGFPWWVLLYVGVLSGGREEGSLEK